VAVKIRLKRLGKIRVPQYRIVVVDSRKKRDGKVLEEIGKYHPKEDPSYIDVVSDRAQYWLGVGAQPSEAVEAILKVTGDWQTFKGLPGTEGTLKVKVPQYRIVVVDSRKKRDGRVLEEIGKYHPKEEPSFIEVTSDRAQYWLGVGAQPSEAVEAILKVTGDWQTFKGLPGTEGTLKVKEPKRSKLDIFNEALKEVSAESKGSATTSKKKAEKKADEPAAAEAPAEVPASETPEGAAEAAEATETVTAEDAGKSEA
jgi:small subunit ribosomal protein S16